VFVIPLRPRRLIRPVVLLAGIAALLLVESHGTAYAPVPQDPPAELRLVPPDVFMITHVNVAGLMGHELTKTVLAFVPTEGPDQKRFGEREFGAPLPDIDAFAVLAGKEHQVVVVTTRKPYDSKKVLAHLAPRATEQTYKGKVFHVGIDPWRLEQRRFEEKKDAFPPRDSKPVDVPKDAGKDKVKQRIEPPKNDGPQFAEDEFPREKFVDKREPGDAPARLEPWAPAVYFLSERTFVTSRVRSIVHFIDKAEKPDEKHPLHEALAAAGRHHLTLGLALSEEMAREMRWEMRRELDRNPLAEMSYFNLRPLLAFRQLTLTGDVGDDSRLDAAFYFPDARAAGKAQDAARFGLQLFKGGVTQIETQVAKLYGGEEKLAGTKLAGLFDSYRTAINEASVKADGSAVKVGLKFKTDSDQIKTVMTELRPKIEAASNRIRSSNNLRQLTIGMHAYHDSMGFFPPASAMYKDGKAVGLSWRVQLLPYIEQAPLYTQFRLDEPWDSEHNKKLIEKMPAVFAVPGVKTKEKGLTYYQGISSQPMEEQTGFILGARVRIAQIVDGVSNTIAFVEAAEPVIWTKPDDVPFNAKGKMLPLVGGAFPDGFHVAFFDGSVHFVRKKDLTEEVFKTACTIAGGEAPNWPAGEDEDDRPRRGYKDKKTSTGEGFKDAIRKDDIKRLDGPVKDAGRPLDKPLDRPFDKVPDRPFDKPIDRRPEKPFDGLKDR
jgi:hypothetical protein